MSRLNENIRIFLCGDVMIGRGIDQILPHPSKSQLYESFVTDAREYIFLAQEANGKFSYPVSFDYIWGDALLIWQQMQPNVKIINLETAITRSDDYWPQKDVLYRMNPRNIGVLMAANIDICVLANNHILDWGLIGLRGTLGALQNCHIKFSGAGENLAQAMQPAIYELSTDKRLLVFSAGMPSSGVPPTWSATSNRPGIYYLSNISHEILKNVAKNIKQFKRPGDLIIFSIHWGSNWGYQIPESFRIFAHGLIDMAEVDIIFGHSSHHPRTVEIYQGKPIFYGCGDFINDYEGIRGYEQYHGDLTLMYFLDFEYTSLQLKKMTLIPLQIKNFSLQRASEKYCKWLLETINQSSTFGAQFSSQDQNLIYTPHS